MLWHILALRRSCFGSHLPLRRVRILVERYLSYGNEVSYTIIKTTAKAVVFIITIFHREVNARQRTLKSLKHFSNFPLDKNSHMREQDFAVQILV